MTGARARDAVISLGLFVGTCVYLGLLWPRAIYGFDEGFFLYEAKRIVDGDVMYRDFFDFVTPVSYYALAVLFDVFGVSMETARLSMAVLHGIIAVLVYLVARLLGVRPGLAAVAAGLYVALCYPALPFASPHWFGTAIALAVLLLMLNAPVSGRGRAVGIGMLTGLMILTEQQKGALAAAAVIVLLRDQVASRPGGTRLSVALARQLIAWAVGVASVVLPVLLGFIAVAGFDNVFDALVRFPLVNYAEYHRTVRWWLLDPEFFANLGSVLRTIARFAPVSLAPFILFSFLPVVVAVSTARVLWRWRLGLSPQEDRPLFVACAFAATAIVSVLYQPNYTHFAMIAPLCLSLVGESLEQMVRRAERGLKAPLVGPVLTAILVAGLALQLQRALAQERQPYLRRRETSFGYVDVRGQQEVDELEALQAALQASAAKRMFVYPIGASLYLLTGTSNATRYQLLIPGYNDAGQIAEVIHTLERERVPIVVRSFFFWGGQKDPLLPYLKQNYERVPIRLGPGQFPTISIFRRRQDGRGATGILPSGSQWGG